MRTPNLGSVGYVPSLPPSDAKALPSYIYDELMRVSAAITSLAEGHLDQVHIAPTKPRNGDIRLADGTNWNPGLGQGVYCYYNSTWNKLG